MSNKTLVEMIEDIDTSYLTEQEKNAAIVSAQTSEILVGSVFAAVAWVKKVASKGFSIGSAKPSHA
ncbi:hypothetical protein ACFQ45_15165 [Rhodanobacter aciditrophus]|uniref:Uncharacterized protein n=1 Tax=Rhodanobacter aciditrophus TaxID=1623218 RepID=A0ABW4B5D4_9GAMM